MNDSLKTGEEREGGGKRPKTGRRCTFQAERPTNEWESNLKIAALNNVLNRPLSQKLNLKIIMEMTIEDGNIEARAKR